MALFNKILGKDEREEKLKQEIKSLEFRKESILASINGEIANLQAEQRNILFEAGKYGYEVWCEEKTQTSLDSYYEKVQELDKQIEAQELKKKEMTDRYDEEIKLIANSFNFGNVNVAAPVMVNNNGASCPNCGASIASDDVFCQNCGTKLQ